MKLNYFIYISAVSICVFASCSKSDVVSEDSTPPVITMLGKNPDTIIVKTAASYNDPGATAMDDVDGDITNKIVVAPQPYDFNNEGSFIIYYNVEDNAHHPAPKLTRVVKVIATTGTYDVSSTCPGNATSTVTISSYSNNDSISIQDFYTAGTIIKAGLNNYKYEIATNVSGITGTISAAGTTLNGVLTISSNSCTAIFIRH